MKKSIRYILRKPNPKYFSIENIFFGLEKYLKNEFNTKQLVLKFSGATPQIIIKNIVSFKRDNSCVYHITGDVHYMAIITGKKTVLTIHDVGSANSGRFLKRLYIKTFWFWLPALFVGRITVISEFTKNELSKIIPFAKSKIRVVPNYVDPQFKPAAPHSNRYPTILFVGTKPNKNLEVSLEAIKDIACEIIIIGELSEKQNVLIKSLKLNVINRSNITRQEVLQSYIECDMVCFASTYEGFGMPIIEAQAIGRPVITSDFGAMKEVAKESACFVNPYDKKSIKLAVLKIIEDNDYKKELIKLGLENCKRFKIEQIAEDYNKIYKELI